MERNTRERGTKERSTRERRSTKERGATRAKEGGARDGWHDAVIMALDMTSLGPLFAAQSPNQAC
eukprot:364260-Chlamydomonas_euryale.AAC.7